MGEKKRGKQTEVYGWSALFVLLIEDPRILDLGLFKTCIKQDYASWCRLGQTAQVLHYYNIAFHLISEILVMPNIVNWKQ